MDAQSRARPLLIPSKSKSSLVNRVRSYFARIKAKRRAAQGFRTCETAGQATR
jgi:hypothetical protein